MRVARQLISVVGAIVACVAVSLTTWRVFESIVGDRLRWRQRASAVARGQVPHTTAPFRWTLGSALVAVPTLAPSAPGTVASGGKAPSRLMRPVWPGVRSDSLRTAAPFLWTMRTSPLPSPSNQLALARRAAGEMPKVTIDVPSLLAKVAVGVRSSSLRDAAIALLVSLWLAGSLVGFALLKPDDVFFFRPVWLLHPFEQEHLTIAKHIAEHGTPFIREPWFGQPGHGSEDMSFRDGTIVPRTALAVYYLYAVPFLISDTAWLWVTPFFGMIAAIGVAAIVARRSNAVVGLLASVGFALTAPVMVAASGLVFDNVIALAFVVWGLYAVDRLIEDGDARYGVIAGLLLAGSALIRPDHAPLGALVVLLLTARHLRRWRRAPLLGRDALATVLVFLPVAAAVLSFLIANRLLYGGAIQTGYSATAVEKGPVWEGSLGGVTHILLTFSPPQFLEMSKAFLIDIGGSQTILLIFGMMCFTVARRFRTSDIALFGFCGFVFVLDLGHSGTHGGARAILVHSPPRYLLPVYTAGIIWGFEAAYRVARLVTGRRLLATMAIVTGVTLLVAGEGLREAYGTQYGFIEVRRTSERTRAVYDFAARHPDDVFVGDIYAKALIGQRTIVPRRLPDPRQLGGYVRDDLAAGRRVFLVDQRSYTATSPDYSGYYDTLRSEGFLLTLASLDPEITEVHLPGTASRPVAISVLAPDRGSSVSGTTRIVADADGIGGIGRVDFFVDDHFLGSRFNPPYSWSWDTRNVFDGAHRISIVGISNTGASEMSFLSIRVGNGRLGDPMVQIVYPQYSEVVSGTLGIVATASDLDGIQLVHFYVDGKYRGSSRQAPYAWRWDTTDVPNGVHSVWAKAIDGQGNATSTYLTVDVRN